MADLIAREIATYLLTESQDPRFFRVTITHAKVSPDLKNAEIFFTLLDEAQISDITVALNGAAGYLQHILAKNIKLRVTPKLTFRYDASLDKANRLASLINNLKNESN